MFFLLFFFFFKQKTAYEMRISDWSSDVCSSDLFEKIWPTALVAPQLRPSPFHPAPWLKGADDASASPCSGSAWGACHAGSSAALAFFRCVAAASLGIERVTALHVAIRSEEHTSELQSLMRISYAVFCLKKKM